jgi:hypothetical protein
MTAHDPIDLRGQEQAKAEVEQKVKLRREQEIADFKLLMSFPWGRRFVWRLLASAGVFRSGFDPSPTQHAFYAGERNQGLRVLHEVNAVTPELYERMVKENA